MIQCQACHPLELHYEIRFLGEENLSYIPDIVTYLDQNNLLVSHKKGVIVVKESGAAGLYDFFVDHLDVHQLSFRIDHHEWRPIHELPSLMEFQWIDQVIAKQSVTCYMQPIVDGEERIIAYEMLSRFKGEAGQFISPAEAFSAAKSRNRTYALDRICRMAAVRHAARIKEKVFINFIPTSIYSPEHCLKSTVQLANLLGIEPSQFVFEVVETEKVEDMDHLRKVLQYYKEKGFHYALDDVGAGFSTVEVLEELAPHYMKLDMKYVQGIAMNPLKQQAANTMLQTALKVGAVPLAEGVEEREDFQWLKANGYQLFQGYLFGKPAPVPEMVTSN
ncbi:EAL domain-containing protein [Bacillus sp. FJAT-27231]|uniref:EAL domain-containing protein n=1 Tax=Bacillus sp. FJAT-27231 TaxID=1679168 RepID=UPI000B1C1BE3|nr:EAL domain-containing protein [Bacillus sp. FJAT-27231]